MANVRSMAKKDWKRFINKSFDLDGTFTAPNGEIATCKVIGINNHNVVETDGQIVMGHIIHVSVYESSLTDDNPNYPTRNASGMVSMANHLVSYLDANNIERNYRVINYMPDNTVGLISMNCEFYSE